MSMPFPLSGDIDHHQARDNGTWRSGRKEMNFFVRSTRLPCERAVHCFAICRNSGWPRKTRALLRCPLIYLGRYLKRAYILSAAIVDLVHQLIISVSELNQRSRIYCTTSCLCSDWCNGTSQCI